MADKAKPTPVVPPVQMDLHPHFVADDLANVAHLLRGVLADRCVGFVVTVYSEREGEESVIRYVRNIRPEFSTHVIGSKASE